MLGNINPDWENLGMLELKLLFPRFRTVILLLLIKGIHPLKRLLLNISICKLRLLLKLGIVEVNKLFDRERNWSFVRVLREHSFPENELLLW